MVARGRSRCGRRGRGGRCGTGLSRQAWEERAAPGPPGAVPALVLWGGRASCSDARRALRAGGTGTRRAEVLRWCGQEDASDPFCDGFFARAFGLFSHEVFATLIFPLKSGFLQEHGPGKIA